MFGICSLIGCYGNDAITWINGFVQTLSADLCATTTVPVDKLISLQTRTCSRVEV